MTAGDARRPLWSCVVLGLAAGAVTCSPVAEQGVSDRQDETTGSAAMEDWREVDPPVDSYSLAPNLTVAGSKLVASWLDRSRQGSGGKSHHLRVSSLTANGWSKPAVIAEGSDFFANWADIPAVVVSENGTLFAHWLAKTGEETYAYSIFLARSSDGGESWAQMGPLNDDDTPTEHGFVAYAPEADGVRAFWLDGREMVEGKPMTLRTARIGDEIGRQEVLDTRVCECCATDAALGGQGPVAVFRDRSDEEIRDIGIVRRLGDSWSSTAAVHVDEWEIPGCPVNGPAVAASVETLAVVWFTASGDRPRVQIAFSDDFGGSFGPVQIVDDGRPLGRVDVVLDDSGDSVVSWLEGVGEGAEIRLRRVSSDGRLGDSITLVRTSAARASGFPRLVRLGDLLYVAWVETDGESTSRVRIGEIPLTSIPL